ncbi:sensor histidine kinase [Pseudoduganella namucuonensis]|uniref:histidine kinase n=1 Tax=Pseudoduganella namucuonensis TaxID=1035707 RepID=A0A1I7M2P1_9BURK|nr:ATP-binding protein [Pseudoduganella namucuonensis]SFV16090.1 two-component system, sensor histidine kinase PhcS [Pseudoduganella namucuonensis]
MIEEFNNNYEAALRAYRLRFSRGVAYTSIVLVMLGVGLDYSLYPEERFNFAMARALVSGLVLGAVGLLDTEWGQRNVQRLTCGWLMLPQLMIGWMIQQTEGANSIYYAGLNLAVFASGIALQFSVRQCLVLGGLTYLVYFVACYTHPAGAEWRGAFAVNSLLLGFTAVASAMCAFYNEQARFMMLQLKGELADKNSQLKQINRDLADIKGQMLQQEKMAAVGTLAAGLLHEVNNPVNFCMMAIDVARGEPAAKASPALMECLTDAREGMRRVQYIVSDLKTFAYRKQGSAHESARFMFARALESAIRLVAHETKDVKIERDIACDTLVHGDEAGIIGVLINLLGNAALAMRKGGSANPHIHVGAVAQGARLKVTVRDNGPGIRPEHLTRVFDPFFTTREVGQGLGLGLSISYGVIQRHGGTLSADSALGLWTQFSFDLPRVTAA